MRARLLRWLIVGGTFAVLELLTRSGAIPEVIMPPPTDIARSLWDLVPTNEFGSDLLRTGVTVAIAFAIGVVAGSCSAPRAGGRRCSGTCSSRTS